MHVINYVGLAIIIAMAVWAYFDIPAEDPEVVKARKEYGKAE